MLWLRMFTIIIRMPIIERCLPLLPVVVAEVLLFSHLLVEEWAESGHFDGARYLSHNLVRYNLVHDFS